MAASSRRWLPRLLAVGLGLGLVGGVEVVLRVAGVADGEVWAPPALVQVVQDGQVAAVFQVRTEPHFVAEALPDGRPGVRTHPAHRIGKGGGFPLGGAMRDVHVAATPARERWVVLGGSAALGLKPVGPRAARGMPTEKLPNGASVLPRELALSGQLERILTERGRPVEVVDAGMIAQDSRAVWRIAEDALALRPTGLVLYLGNNESLGMAKALQDVAVPEVAVVRGALRHLRIYRALLGVLRPAPPASAPSSPAGPRKAGGKAGHETLARVVEGQWRSAGRPLVEGAEATDDVRVGILGRFEENLRGIVEMAQASGVRVVVLPTPPHLTYPPFTDAHDPGLSEAALEAAARAHAEADAALRAGDAATAAARAQDAVDGDPAHAGAWFVRGLALGQLGENEDAVDALERALARDVSHKRTDPAFAGVAARVCVESGGCVAGDAHRALTARARFEGIAVYDEILGDHEHLNPAGNAWVAGQVADLVLAE